MHRLDLGFASLHGCMGAWVHMRRSLTQPFAYEAYRAARVAEKLEGERASRITVAKRLPKVG